MIMIVIIVVIIVIIIVIVVVLVIRLVIIIVVSIIIIIVIIVMTVVARHAAVASTSLLTTSYTNEWNLRSASAGGQRCQSLSLSGECTRVCTGATQVAAEDKSARYQFSCHATSSTDAPDLWRHASRS